MAETKPIVSAPTRAQVRDYVLAMLEGLATLADSVDDPQVGERIRDFSDELIMAWSPRAETGLRQGYGRATEEPDR